MNVFCFAGNICKDLELRTTQNNKKVVSFTVAINEGKDKTEFVNMVAWEKNAELLAQYCKKGDRLSGSGRLQTRSWEADGQKKYMTECVVYQFDFPPKGVTPAKAPEDTGGWEEDLEDQIPF